MNKRIWLSSPHMGGKEQDFVKEAFETNWVAPLGPNVNGFEKDLSAFTGVEHTAALVSGTSAIHLALILLGIRSGDRVICQSFTFSASANPIRYQGAIPIFVDSEADTWNMSPQFLREAIVEQVKEGYKPKAIIAVHLYGMPAKMEEILNIATEFDIPLIEDAAEALGSHINGQSCSSFGDFGILSFNGNKIITTSGGGALQSSQQQFIDQARFLATQARDQAPHYQHSQVGYNYRMSNIVAGIGRGQMLVLNERIEQRRRVFYRYVEAFGENWLDVRYDLQSGEWEFHSNAVSTNGIYFLKEPEGYFSNRWLTTIVVNPEETGGISREDIRIALEKENIECRPLWKPMHLQPIFSEFPYYGNGLSEFLFEYGLCLPSGSNLTIVEQDRVIKLIQQIIQS